MEAQCAMRLTQSMLGGKVPTLFESYEAIMGRHMKNQHTALGDANACMEVFKQLVTGGAKPRTPTPARSISKAIKTGRNVIKAAFHA
jgi:hypothetical protein